MPSNPLLNNIEIAGEKLSLKKFGECLKDREWRLNHLYWIKNDQGDRIPFRMNWAQQILFNGLWYLNVILKVRQIGITTFFCILYLDDCIFNGLDAGLIAHTLADATRIFDTKIKYAWDNLPEVLKAQYEVDTNNARELRFKIGDVVSSIYIGTSLRSGTVQRLHISELGTVDQRYPDKAEEIRSGALNIVHKGQIVTIESTAKGQIGIFYDICRAAMDIKQRGNKPGEMDWKFFFFPWYLHLEYRLAGEYIYPSDLSDYFRKLELSEGLVLDQEQKNWYFKKSQTQGESMRSEFPTTPDEAFMASIEGAYYGKQMDLAMAEGRIKSVPWDPTIPVDTWWDIGTNAKKSDATSITFTQDIGLEVHVIDFYGGSAEGLAHYIKMLKEKPYIYRRHYGPHDLAVVELGTGKSRLEMAGSLGLRFEVIPLMPFSDGIEAARMIFSRCWFDEQKTSRLTQALRSYRKEWDDNLGKFKDKPLKDWAADPCDSFRIMALGHRDQHLLGFYDKEEEELRAIQDHLSGRGRIDPFNPFGNI